MGWSPPTTGLAGTSAAAALDAEPAGGGALDIVQDGQNGVLFHAQTVEALTAALERVTQLPVDPPALRASASMASACA